MIGFDIGGTKCSVSIGENINGELFIKSKKVIPTDLSVSPYEMIDRMFALAEEQTDFIDIIGISCGGPLNSKTGTILSPPNLPGWDNVNITEYIEKKYNCKAYLQNDANACALAEWKYGAGMGYNNVVFLTFGTGLGAGLILDGKLYSGTNDMAGEVGHIRLEKAGPVGFGKAGSFEGFCSGHGIAELGKMYAQKAFASGKEVSFCHNLQELDKINAKTIADSARLGNTDAIEVFNICAEKLGTGLSVIIDILNPEAIIIGSVFQRCEDLLRDICEKVIEKEALSEAWSVCKILPAKLKDNIGDIAALSVAAVNSVED